MKLEIIGEKRPSMVSGVFGTEDDAKHAVACLVHEGDFNSEHISLIPPNDKYFEQKVEPDEAGIARTLLKSHLVFGFMGLLIGLILAAMLTLFGPPLAQSSPMFTTMALALICFFIGLIVAGLVSVRPDHDPLIVTTRAAIRSGSWAVVVHTLDKDEMYRAKIVMSGSAESLSETL